MIFKHWFLVSCWIYLAQCSPINYQKVRFLPTSFSKRTDSFFTTSKIPPRNSKHLGIEDFFSIDLPVAHLDLSLWNPNQGLYQINSLNYGPELGGYQTPDFSNGLAYPDPFLLSGVQAKQTASYLYSKELFYHNIPHIRAVLYNQEERKKNGLLPHRIGSIRSASPWYRFKEENFRSNRLFI